MKPNANRQSPDCKLTALMLAAGMAVWIFPRSVEATEKYAAQTGVPCAQCHVYPTGDARLTPFGEAFVANGFKLPANESKPPADGSKPPADGSKAPAGGSTPPK